MCCRSRQQRNATRHCLYSNRGTGTIQLVVCALVLSFVHFFGVHLTATSHDITSSLSPTVYLPSLVYHPPSRLDLRFWLLLPLPLSPRCLLLLIWKSFWSTFCKPKGSSSNLMISLLPIKPFHDWWRKPFCRHGTHVRRQEVSPTICIART
jgi:hypothetical protein